MGTHPPFSTVVFEKEVSKMKPKLMQGHERAITAVRYNTTGDILFSTAKDKSPHATYAANGERMGTYEGHGGALWGIDVNDDTSKLLTGAADNTMRLWEAETGVEIAQYAHKTPVRTVRPGRQASALRDGQADGPPVLHVDLQRGERI